MATRMRLLLGSIVFTVGILTQANARISSASIVGLLSRSLQALLPCGLLWPLMTLAVAIRYIEKKLPTYATQPEDG